MGNEQSRVILDHQDQPFYPGSSVTGHVLVEVDKPKTYKKILIHFHGKAHVQWAERRFGGSGTATSTVNYTSSEDYVDLEQTLWTANQTLNDCLPPGQSKFPFRFDIPPNAPSSFEGTNGSIQYTLIGRIVTGPLKFDKRMEVAIPVQQVEDISDPCLLQPVCKKVQEKISCQCCASAPIVLTITIPKTGYYIGEMIPVHVSIENGSSHFIIVKASLHQSVVYTAQGQHRYNNMCLCSIQNDKIAPHTTCEWNPSLLIPATDVLDKCSCSMIKISYSLKITTANTLLGSNLYTEIPLKLTYACGQPPLDSNNLPPLPTSKVQPSPPYPQNTPPPTTPALYQAAPMSQTP